MAVIGSKTLHLLDAPLLLTAAQSLIDLDQLSIVRLRLRPSQLSGKRIRLISKDFQVVGSPGLEAHLREPRRILGVEGPFRDFRTAIQLAELEINRRQAPSAPRSDFVTE